MVWSHFRRTWRQHYPTDWHIKYSALNVEQWVQLLLCEVPKIWFITFICNLNCSLLFLIQDERSDLVDIAGIAQVCAGSIRFEPRAAVLIHIHPSWVFLVAASKYKLSKSIRLRPLPSDLYFFTLIVQIANLPFTNGILKWIRK